MAKGEATVKGTERAPEDGDKSVLWNGSLFSLRLWAISKMWVTPVTVHRS